MAPSNVSNPIEKYFHRMTPYHYYCFFLLFATKLPVFWHVLSLIFLSPPMNYNCKHPVNKTVSENQCPCDDPEWNRSVFTETIQTKYGILCERTWLVSFSQSMLYVGTLLGALLFGVMSDRYGRLSMFTLSCFTLSVAGCVVAAMPSAPTFTLMRCIEGMGVGGAIVTGYVLCVEYCGINYREMVTALFHLPLNVSHMSLAGISYVLRHCDSFQLALSIPSFLCVLVWCLILESPKWLIDSGQVEKATRVMEKIEKFNNHPTENIKPELEAFHANNVSQKHKKLSFWQIFRHRRLTINLMCMSFIYFVCGMGYYGVSQYIGKMSGNIHLNVAISGTLLIPGTIICAFLLKKLGRRSFLMATSFLSGFFMIIVILMPSHDYWAWGRVLVACICNSFFFMSFIIVFLYGVELFPTSIRNSVLGFLSVLSRVGQIVAPPINALSETISGAIFGVMAIMGGVLCYPLPETKGVELPSSLEDSESIPRTRSRVAQDVQMN